MGKVFDMLRQPAPTQGAATAPAASLQEAVVEMPFIEIGPTRGAVEGSPTVMAALVPAPRQPVTAAAASLPPSPPAPPPPGSRPHCVQLMQVNGSPAAQRAALAPELVAYHAPDEAASAGYAELLASLVRAADGLTAGAKVLLFTGTRAGAGATTVLLNVAITAARQNRWVLVIDANLRRPALAARLGLGEAPGLLEVLSGECQSVQALTATAQDRLLAMPAGKPGPLFANADGVGGLLQELRGRFDLILIDGPHWDGKPGVAMLAAAADAVFLVAPPGEADRPPASELVRSLPSQKVKLAGCVVAGAAG